MSTEPRKTNRRTAMSATRSPGFTTATVTVIIMADKDVTVARANLGGTEAAGSARREPGDRPDAGIGADLAVARALARLSAKLGRRARGQVRHAEAVKAHRAARRVSRTGDVLAEVRTEGGGASSRLTGYSLYGSPAGTGLPAGEKRKRP
jgi:Domain of unknown function (DUF1876)